MQDVEDLKICSTHRTPSTSGPINGDANTSTIGQQGPSEFRDYQKNELR